MVATVIMAYNEADVLPRCVESARPLGEVHISVDRQSSDDSLVVARELTEFVYQHEGLPEDPPKKDAPKSTEARNSYARMRNDVLAMVEEQTRARWLLWLDADEVVIDGHEALSQYVAQLDPVEYQAVIVPMRLFTAEGTPIRTLRNSKVIQRGTRFVRRRHEHIEFPPDKKMRSGYCGDVLLGHIPNQPQRVRADHDMRKGQYEPYEADWREFQDSRAAFYVANYWLNVGQIETALRWYDKALSLPPEKRVGLSAGQLEFYAARAYLQAGYISDARRLFFETLLHEWNCGPVFFYLGAAAALVGDHEQARHWFNLALQYPEEPETFMETDLGYTRAMPLFGLASLAHNEGDREEAYRLLAEAERLMPYSDPRFTQLRAKLDGDGADELLYGRTNQEALSGFGLLA